MILLDSSFLIAYHNSRDVHHDSARSAMDPLVGGEWGEAVLLEYVFLEVVTVLLARRDLETATRVGSGLLEAREVQFLPCSDFFLETLEVFRTQKRGDLSFADAAIVAAARETGAGYVASFDRDFATIDGLELVPLSP